MLPVAKRRGILHAEVRKDNGSSTGVAHVA
jgi:hypothetical protein